MASKLKAHPPAEVKPGHAQILLSGSPGSGKTWLALAFPSVYLIDTEGGADMKHYMERLRTSGGEYMGPDDGACDFDTILEQVKALATEKHKFRTLCIDSITKVYNSTIAKRASELGDKDAFGASKKPAIAYMRQLVSWLPKLDMNVVLTAHEVATWGGEGKDRKQTGFGPDIWPTLIHELDLTLRVEKHSRGFRTATVEKSRFLSFPEFERITLQDAGSDTGYKAFAERFGRESIERPAEPVKLATPEQIAEIERILSFVKIDQDEIDKKFTKYGAEKWADLTEDQANGALKWLASLIPAPAKVGA